MARFFPASVYVPHSDDPLPDGSQQDAIVIGRINDALGAARLDYRLVPLDPAQFVRAPKRARRKARR